MVEINRDSFKKLPQDEKDDILFDSIVCSEAFMKDLNGKVDSLLKSPWRLANLPTINWTKVGVFVAVMTAIIKGDMTLVTKLLSAFGG